MTEEEFDKAADVACQLHVALGNLFRQKLEEAKLSTEQRESMLSWIFKRTSGSGFDMVKNIEFFDASKIPTPWPFPIYITGGKAHKVPPPPPPVKVKSPPLEDAFF